MKKCRVKVNKGKRLKKKLVSGIGIFSPFQDILNNLDQFYINLQKVMKIYLKENYKNIAVFV